jgi:hypothetical protein
VGDRFRIGHEQVRCDPVAGPLNDDEAQHDAEREEAGAKSQLGGVKDGLARPSYQDPGRLVAPISKPPPARKGTNRICALFMTSTHPLRPGENSKSASYSFVRTGTSVRLFWFDRYPKPTKSCGASA